MAPPRCPYCGKAFQTPRAVNHHVSASKSCSRGRLNAIIRKDNNSASPSPKRQKIQPVGEFDNESEPNLAAFDNPLVCGDDFIFPSLPREPSIEVGDGTEHGENTYPKNERFIESFHGEAGNGLRRSETQFELWLKNQKDEEKIPWFLFASEQEWALAKWLLKNVGQKSTDDFLKLPIVCQFIEAFV